MEIHSLHEFLIDVDKSNDESEMKCRNLDCKSKSFHC